MPIAVFADIHANKEALEACLEHASQRAAARYVLLGDLRRLFKAARLVCPPTGDLQFSPGRNSLSVATAL